MNEEDARSMEQMAEVMDARANYNEWAAKIRAKERKEILDAMGVLSAHLIAIRSWVTFGGIVLILAILTTCAFVACSGPAVSQLLH